MGSSGLKKAESAELRYRRLFPVRQFDRNVPRGAYHDRASIGVDAAYYRFQNQKELLRKHGRCLVCSVFATDR